MSQRKITESELVAHLNSELEKHEQCNDCRFEHIQKSSQTDEHGCNWSLPMFRCSGVPASACKSTAEHAIFEARKIFNLK